MNLFRDAEVPSTRKFLLGAGHLAALWALAFAQPLFDLLGKNPDFFVARENSPGDVRPADCVGVTGLPNRVFDGQVEAESLEVLDDLLAPVPRPSWTFAQAGWITSGSTQ